jgi:peptide/nickel transport system ATP-binding protein
MDATVEVRNLKVYYFTRRGPVRAVDDVSFSVVRGQTLGIVGESGCGKTTVGVSLLGMPTPPGRIVGGRILIDGTDIVPMTENEIRKGIRWEKISMVFQGAMSSLTPVFTIGAQMNETLQRHRPVQTAESRRLIKKYLGLVGLPQATFDRYPHELSGGMKQRVVIATALFLEPHVVVLDEPTTALDVIVQAQIINLLKELKKRLSLSLIFITHDLGTEAEVAEHVLVMYAGRVAETGTNDQIFSKPCHPYTRSLLDATPRLHRKTDELTFIPGTPPDLLNPPSGCRFHPRCPVAFERCPREVPPLLEIEPAHSAACWRCYDA